MSTPEMSDGLEEPVTPAPSRRGQVRLRRAALMAVPAVLLGGTMMVLTAQGVLAAQLEISGMPFTVTADKLDGTGFEQFGKLDHMIDGSPNAGDTGGTELVVVSAIKDAHLTNLCQSVDLGGISLVIRAGRGSTLVHATDLTTDSTIVEGDASFNNIEIGNDASKLTAAGVAGPAGVFGQQSDKVTINNLRQTNYATTAATFTLPGLHLSFDSDGC
jgi:hypothetical protein